MWQQYRTTFLIAQIVIVALTAYAYHSSGGNWGLALLVLGTMQLSNVAGAWWGARLGRRIRERSNCLPLHRA